jgi:D-alanine-D-alanine ligase
LKWKLNYWVIGKKTMNKMQIAVIFGGRSSEHEVSLRSARFIISMLSPEKYEVTCIGITKDGHWLSGENILDAFESGKTAGLHPVTILPEPGNSTLYAFKQSEGRTVLEPQVDLDVVFPVLHGTFGEDGTLQGLLEMAGLAYAGAGVLGSAVGMDKALFKEVLRANNLPVVDSVIANVLDVKERLHELLDEAEEIGSYPLFVKPANMGSSVGITKCRSRSDLMEGVMDAIRFDRRILIEKGINAREIEISVMGNEDPQVSLPGEIRPEADFYTYQAKYLDDTSELIIPANLDMETTQYIQQVALQVYKAIDCAGLARVDFLMDRDSGQIFVNEVNTMPGFTSISMYPKLWEASGIPSQELVDRLIGLALQRKTVRDGLEYQYGSEA